MTMTGAPLGAFTGGAPAGALQAAGQAAGAAPGAMPAQQLAALQAPMGVHAAVPVAQMSPQHQALFQQLTPAQQTVHNELQHLTPEAKSAFQAWVSAHYNPQASPQAQAGKQVEEKMLVQRGGFNTRGK